MADECEKDQSPPDNYDDDKDNEDPSDDDEEDYRPMQKSRGRGNYRYTFIYADIVNKFVVGTHESVRILYVVWYNTSPLYFIRFSTETCVVIVMLYNKNTVRKCRHKVRLPLT
jgi:hypothetical protein